MIALMKNGMLWLEHGSGIIHSVLCLLNREYAICGYPSTSIESHGKVNHNLLLPFMRISASMMFDNIEKEGFLH